MITWPLIYGAKITVDYSELGYLWALITQGTGCIAWAVIIFYGIPRWLKEYRQSIRDARYKPVRDYDKIKYKPK